MVQKTFKDTVSRIVEDILQDNVRLSMPARVVSVAEYETHQCIDVKPLVNNLYKDNLAVVYPIIFCVPVVLLGGGNALISVPIKVGDIVKLDFSRDSIEEFMQSQGKTPVTPLTFRRYALTDAVATPAWPTRVTTLHPNPNDLEIKTLAAEGGVNASIRLTPEGNLFIDAVSDLPVTVGGNATINISGQANITVGGNCNLAASTVNVDASVTNLGSGGNKIARVGDTIEVVVTSGSSAGTWSGTIKTGGVNSSI